ncbi:MAG: 2-oxo acid dehydrogenase subunit E2 [Myxococcota bacterium]|nr:2-oxo acid dehydrogenase subunit E2 [Myxococcota bacterium]
MTSSHPVLRSATVGLDGEDRVEVLPLGERWFPDAFQVIPGPGGLALRLVDMAQAKLALQFLCEGGVRATFTHLIVRAAALALARNPELHHIVCNYQRMTPGAVDIGLSMAGETTYAPVVVLPMADRKPLGTLVEFMNESIAAWREKETRDLESLRQKGWVVPFGFLRRLLLRWFQKTFWFRRRLVGTFQVSCLASVDVVASFLFYTGSILCAGSVRDRVVAQGGQAVVRPTVWLTVCVDHAAMDGRRAGQLLKAIKRILESDELVREAQDAAASRHGWTAPDNANTSSGLGIHNAFERAT